MDLLHTDDDTFSMVLSSELLPIAPVNNTLQKRLQAVLDETHEGWCYAIFWQPSYNDFYGESVLQWGDGIYRGKAQPRRGKKKKTAGDQEEHWREVLREISAMMEDDQHQDQDQDQDHADDLEVKGAELFYFGSMTWTFGSGSGLAGKTFTTHDPVWVTGSDQIFGSGCDRAKHGWDLGLQTIVCIPSDDGVLELGSMEQIQQNLDLFNKIRFLFNFQGFDNYFGAPNNSYPNSQFPQAQFEYGSSSTVTNSLNPNPSFVYPPYIHNNSNVVWTTTRVPSSEATSFGNMNPNVGHMQNSNVVPAKKLRRTLAHGPMSHMESERQRREIINQGFNTLREILPNALRMKKVMLLDHVILYINELTSKVKKGESEKNKIQIQLNEFKEKLAAQKAVSSVCENEPDSGLKIDVNIIGCDAMIRVESSKRTHPGKRLMKAFMDLELELNHASILVTNDLMIQQATVKMETRSYTQEQLCDSLISKIG